MTDKNKQGDHRQRKPQGQNDEQSKERDKMAGAKPDELADISKGITNDEFEVDDEDDDDIDEDDRITQRTARPGADDEEDEPKKR